MKRAALLKMNQRAQKRKQKRASSVTAILVCLTGGVGGCAWSGRFLRPTTTIDSAATAKILAAEPRSIDSNLTETEPPERGKPVVAAEFRPGDVKTSTAAHRIPDSKFAAMLSGVVEESVSESSSDREFPATVSISVPPTAAASEVPLARSVDYFVNLALTGHPSIMAARHRISVEINRIPQARALPDPMLNNVFWPIQDQSLQTAAGRVDNQMSLTQSIPWPEKRRTQAAIVSQEVQIARSQLKQIEREITESVRLAYYEVWFATRAITILEETQELVRDLEQVAEVRYRGGGTQQDVLRARLESDRLEDQRVGLVKQKEMAQADLASLVQEPISLVAQTDPELMLDEVPSRIDELIDSAERCNPKLSGLAWEIQRDRQKQKLACLQRYPDLQVGLHWGLVSDDMDAISPVANGRDTISFNVGTTLPIWREKIQAGIRQAAHQTSNSAQRLEAERDALYGKIRRLLAQATALDEQRGIYKDRIIPRAEDTLRLSIADYRGKRTDFFSLVETYRELLMFETQLARIEATLAGTLAQIDRAVGCAAE